MAQAFIRILSVLLVSVFGLHKIALSADQAILEQAKKEGQLVFYSGIFESEARALISRFEQRYPFIKTTLYRAGGVSLVSRIQNETRAGSHLWDVFNSAGVEGFVLLEQGYFENIFLLKRDTLARALEMLMVFGPRCMPAHTSLPTILGWCRRKTFRKIILTF
jgi:hypothetical protein